MLMKTQTNTAGKANPVSAAYLSLFQNASVVLVRNGVTDVVDDQPLMVHLSFDGLNSDVADCRLSSTS